QSIPVVERVLIFLDALSEWEPVKATKKGNMSLGFSKDLAEKMYGNKGFPWFRKVRSEEDMTEVLSIRHILTMCGWIKKRIFVKTTDFSDASFPGMSRRVP
ncbi:MAG: hypothetical protein U9N37_02000, partial [Thermodesulfobacteriota bacterium]|nr:hypothetical protein [Thermodesulfobacteriota bacterium]